jgi:hypothetical protein
MSEDALTVPHSTVVVFALTMMIAIIIILVIADNMTPTTTIATIIPTVFEVTLTTIPMIVIRHPLSLFWGGGVDDGRNDWPWSSSLSSERARACKQWAAQQWQSRKQ